MMHLVMAPKSVNVTHGRLYGLLAMHLSHAGESAQIELDEPTARQLQRQLNEFLEELDAVRQLHRRDSNAL